MTPAPKPRKSRKHSMVNGVITYPDGREVCADTAAGETEYFYRRLEMERRQNGRCAICGEFFTLHRPGSFDHSRTRGMGGGYRDDRIEVDGKWQNAALCVPCQGIKGSARYHWNKGRNKQGEYVKRRRG